MDVIKIGGSILANINDLEFAARRIAEYSSHGKLPIVVVSAFKDYTDSLVQMARYFDHNDDLATSFVTTTGEQITAGLFAKALQKYGRSAKALAGWQVPIIMNSNGAIDVQTDKIFSLLENGVIPIVTGFQAVNENNDICDLGRGGSDLTAVCLADKFNRACVLVKKSGGICSADPDLNTNYFVWSDVGYENLMHLLESGARVVQKDALQVAINNNVRVRVTNLTFSSATDIVQKERAFWSLIKHNDALRIVTNLFDTEFAGFDFCKNGNYYEMNCAHHDISQEASRAYDLCASMLGK